MAVMTRSEAKLLLDDVWNEKAFYTCNGLILRNLRELADELSTMPEGIYCYHVTPEKNDFAKWVEEVVHDKELADTLRKAPNREAAARAVTSRVVALTKKL